MQTTVQINSLEIDGQMPRHLGTPTILSQVKSESIILCELAKSNMYMIMYYQMNFGAI